MRARGYRFAIAGLALTGALFVGAGVAAAQTTTLPPVRTIPVTGATTSTTAARATTTTTAAAAVSSATANAMASTGIAADMLVPLGFALIGAGGAMQVAARRPRRDLGLL